jgi:hypothetical protein
MWVFLSRRLRLWLLLAVALPLARSIVHALASRAQRRAPDGRPTKLLTRADSLVSSVARRAEKRRGR